MLLHIPWQMGLRTKCLVRVVDINMETHKSSHPFMKRNPYFYGLLLGKPQAMWGLRVFLFWKWSETGRENLFFCCAAKKFKRCSSVRSAMTRKSESNYEKNTSKKCGAQKMYVRTFTPMVGWNGKYFSGLVTISILFCWLFKIEDRCKKVRFQQAHNQGLRQLLLTVSWDLRA